MSSAMIEEIARLMNVAIQPEIKAMLTETITHVALSGRLPSIQIPSTGLPKAIPNVSANDLLAEKDLLTEVESFIRIKGGRLQSTALSERFGHRHNWRSLLQPLIDNGRLVAGGHSRGAFFAIPDDGFGVFDSVFNPEPTKSEEAKKFRAAVADYLIANPFPTTHNTGDLFSKFGESFAKDGVERMIGDFAGQGRVQFIYTNGEIKRRIVGVRCIEPESLKQFRQSEAFNKWALPRKS